MCKNFYSSMGGGGGEGILMNSGSLDSRKPNFAKLRQWLYRYMYFHNSIDCRLKSMESVC